jgi:hypothetical protein
MSNTYVFDGVTYVKVDRKAKVGDYVLITKFDGYKVKAIRRVVKLSSYTQDFYVDEPVGRFHEDYLDGDDDEYKTLEPLLSSEELCGYLDDKCCEGPTVDQSQDSPSVTDLLANLASRVYSLEQQLRDTQVNVEKLAEELANVKYFGECNTEDILALYARSRSQSKSSRSKSFSSPLRIRLPRSWSDKAERRASDENNDKS